MILDLYCSAGGVGLALDRLGFEHIGIDIEDKSAKYTGTFVQGDASHPPFDLEGPPQFDLVWASPPCQAYSRMSNCQIGRKFDDPKEYYPTIDELNVRKICQSLGKEYIIENVDLCDDLHNPTFLNGFAFGKNFNLTRAFETSFSCPSARDYKTGGLTLRGSETHEVQKQDLTRQLAEEKGVPTEWSEPEINSAIPQEYVQHLLHYCPSIDGISPVKDTKQGQLSEWSE